MDRYSASSSALILLILAAVALSAGTRAAWCGEYTAPLPFATMYDQLKVGMGWNQAHEITRAPELQREPSDFDVTDLLRLEQVSRRFQAHLLRLHWYKGALHWIEFFQLGPGGVAYQEQGDPDPIGDRLVKRLTALWNLYASQWEELTAAVAAEGSPALQAKVTQATEALKQRLEELRGDTLR